MVYSSSVMEMTQAIREKVEHLASVAFTSTGRVLEKYQTPGYRGCSRTVLIDREHGVAYKLMMGGLRSTANDNWREWRLWRKLPPEARLITAEALAISKCGKVLAMELMGETLNKSCDDPDEMDRIRKEFNAYLKLCLAERFTEAQIEDMMEDNHSANMAYREDGSLAWIDYASI